MCFVFAPINENWNSQFSWWWYVIISCQCGPKFLPPRNDLFDHWSCKLLDIGMRCRQQWNSRFLRFYVYRKILCSSKVIKWDYRFYRSIDAIKFFCFSFYFFFEIVNAEFLFWNGEQCFRWLNVFDGITAKCKMYNNLSDQMSKFLFSTFFLFEWHNNNLIESFRAQIVFMFSTNFAVNLSWW